MCMIQPFRIRSLLVASFLGAGAGFLPTPAPAEIQEITVTSAEDIGPFAGKPYREMEVRMKGSAPGGPYEVPLTIAFPTSAADFGGFTVVDIFNTVTLLMEGFPTGGEAKPLARTHMGEAFLFGRGTGYIGVLWDKLAIEKLGTGSIAIRSDGFTILRDVATLARNPARYLPADASRGLPEEARTIAYGFSQSGSLLRDWFFDGHNMKNDTPAFDGGLPVGAAGWCQDLVSEDGKACPGAVTDGAKVIVLLAEGDVEWGGTEERADHPDYRVIDMAGVAHIPSTASDFRQLGMPEQNPIGFEPAVRAALVNLEDWLDGREPPPSILIELSDGPSDTLMGDPLAPLARDEDGNAVGGLRLPHMPSVLAGSTKAGAPLGTYTGLALDHQADNIYLVLGGTFTPFPKERLQSLYPDHAAYVTAVTAAAEDLAEKRYILPEDAAAYIDAAEAAEIGVR